MLSCCRRLQDSSCSVLSHYCRAVTALTDQYRIVSLLVARPFYLWYSTWSWHRTLLRLSLQCFIQLFDRPVILYLLCCSLFERWDVLQFFSLLSSVICNSGCCWLNHVRLCAKCLLLLSRELNKRDKFFFWMNSAACLILYWNLLQFVQSCFLPKCSILTPPALRVRLYLVLHLMTGVTNHVAQTRNKPSLLYCPNWNSYVKWTILKCCLWN